MTKILFTTGKGYFSETEWTLPERNENEITVKSIMTGVCRSDIDMMNGAFSLPLHMQGHEGLGEVIAVGSMIADVVIGDIVATRGEPAFSDMYHAASGTYVKVPSADPRYIIEPIACGVNIVQEIGRTDNVCIIGSGFMANIVYQTLKHFNPTSRIDVVGNHNKELWKKKFAVDIISYHDNLYDTVIDLSNNDIALKNNIVKENGQLILGAAKHPAVACTFDRWLWNNLTIKCPSPRSPNFFDAMKTSVSLIEKKIIDIDEFWTRGYDRNTEWQTAFSDAVDRKPGYNRGYIFWS